MEINEKTPLLLTPKKEIIKKLNITDILISENEIFNNLQNYLIYHIVIENDNYSNYSNYKILKKFVKEAHKRNKKVIVFIKGGKKFWKDFLSNNNVVKDHKITTFVKRIKNFMEYHDLDGIAISFENFSIFKYKKFKYLIKFLKCQFNFERENFYFQLPKKINKFVEHVTKIGKFIKILIL